MPRGTGANGLRTRLSVEHAAAAVGRLPPVGWQVSVHRRMAVCGSGRTVIVSDTDGRGLLGVLLLAPLLAACEPQAVTSASTAAVTMAAADVVEAFMPVGR